MEINPTLKKKGDILSLFNKRINEIELQDIENLIEDQEPESKQLEYKGKMERNDEKSAIKKAVCGFANADGGLFIYGLEEDENKKLEDIKGISLNDTSWDEKKRSILSTIENNIEPHVDVEIGKIELNDNKVVILIKVPKSWNAPHCIKKNNGKNRSFYIRRDGSTNPMEFEEIKTMFDLNNSLLEKINDYRDKRVSLWSSKNKNKYKVMFHAIPFDAISINQIDFKKARTVLNKEFLNGYYFSDFEGLFNNQSLYKGKLFRNGIFEIILEEYRDEGGVNVRNPYLEFKKFINDSLEVYNELGIFCPIIYFITFTNVKGRNMLCNPREHYNLTDFERDTLNPSGLIIKDKTQIDICVHNMFVPIWNHFGKDVDYIFDESKEE